MCHGILARKHVNIKIESYLMKNLYTSFLVNGYPLEKVTNNVLSCCGIVELWENVLFHSNGNWEENVHLLNNDSKPWISDLEDTFTPMGFCCWRLIISRSIEKAFIDWAPYLIFTISWWFSIAVGTTVDLEDILHPVFFLLLRNHVT